VRSSGYTSVSWGEGLDVNEGSLGAGGDLIGGVNVFDDDVGNVALEHLEHSFRGPGFLKLGEAAGDPQESPLQVRSLPLLPQMCDLSARANQEGRVLSNESWFCRVPSFLSPCAFLRFSFLSPPPRGDWI